MSEDLEETLAELGPKYRALVGRMRSAFPEERSASPSRRLSPFRRFAPAAVLAASLAVALALSAVFSGGGTRSCGAGRDYLLAYGGADAVGEILRTQGADGSWKNDFITRQNAAALKGVAGAEAAYLRALRYLRAKGLRPLSDEELAGRAAAAGCGARDAG